MRLAKVILLCMCFPLVLHGRGAAKDTLSIRVNLLTYELTTSVDSVTDEHGKRLSALHVKLAKQGKVMEERIFPFSGQCPIEEEINVEGSDKGFILCIPYCDGYLFRIGRARFVYAASYDRFILSAYKEEITDRLHPELESKTIVYEVCPTQPIVLSDFSPETVKHALQ